MARYQRPDWFTKRVFNPLILLLMRLGVSLRGSRILAVQGRKTGKWYTVPVNPLPFEGARYLVAPRGHTQWVRNIRVSRAGELRLGRRREPIHVVEVPDEEKPPLLRAYLKFWAWEVGMFFGGVKHDSPEEDLRRIAPDHPAFRILEP